MCMCWWCRQSRLQSDWLFSSECWCGWTTTCVQDNTIDRTGIAAERGATLLPQMVTEPARPPATEHSCWRLKKQLLCPCCTMLNPLSSTWRRDRVNHVSVTASHIHHHTGYCGQDGDSHCCVNGAPMCCRDTSSYTELSYHRECCYQLLYSPPLPNLS